MCKCSQEGIAPTQVGRLLLNVCSASPDGVVAFVPSFAQLDLLMARWESTGLKASLEGRKKVRGVLTWPSPSRASHNWLHNCMSPCFIKFLLFSPCQVLREPAASSDIESVLVLHTQSISEARARRQAGSIGGQTGALLMCVVGGKLSEGINFGDELGRCVVVVGLPYPNPTDPELRERMRFIDRQAEAHGLRAEGGRDGLDKFTGELHIYQHKIHL